ncbi:aminopeptidase P family protein [Fusobacterium sp. MFO224]|uniref:aminopeptidase P family protein n=1 Tax=Fusobacterium sp. MFO224 TaxID=3378070 RepID=UPI003853AB3F
MKLSVDNKLNLLRELMIKNSITAYLVTSSDFHQSEYTGNFFKTREYISNFSGSSGTVLITLDNAYLWTDGRYFLQAEKELSGSEFHLFKTGLKDTPTVQEFIKNTMKNNDTLAFDGRTVSYNLMLEFISASKEKFFQLKINMDLINEIWENRPPLSKEKVFLLEEQYSGEKAVTKLKRLRHIMINKNATCHILSSLDDICWLFNLRGKDIKYNPVVLSYAIIFIDKTILFIDKSKISTEIELYFNNINVEIQDYNGFYKYLHKIDSSSVVLLDYNKINSSIYQALPKEIHIINEINPENSMKSIKNLVEIKNNYRAHIKDGVAMTKFIYWLKNNISKNKISELDVVNKIEAFRKGQEGFMELSFETIAAYGKNAAMMHYLPNNKNFSFLEPKNLILIDSGGQYLEGTTDITRTISLGNVDPQIKKHYTYVLKSLIALSKSKFPHHTFGGSLDSIARNVIWEIGLDYRCATGHGVGHFLNVHEGPNILRPSADCIISPDMVTTIEPGIYIDNSHGIRLENETLTTKSFKNEYGLFLEFKTLTFVPIDIEAIELCFLNKEEINWINSYHEMVFEKISPFLNREEAAWLKSQTKNI